MTTSAQTATTASSHDSMFFGGCFTDEQLDAARTRLDGYELPDTPAPKTLLGKVEAAVKRAFFIDGAYVPYGVRQALIKPTVELSADDSGSPATTNWPFPNESTDQTAEVLDVVAKAAATFTPAPDAVIKLAKVTGAAEAIATTNDKNPTVENQLASDEANYFAGVFANATRQLKFNAKWIDSVGTMGNVLDPKTGIRVVLASGRNSLGENLLPGEIATSVAPDGRRLVALATRQGVIAMFDRFPGEPAVFVGVAGPELVDSGLIKVSCNMQLEDMFCIFGDTVVENIGQRIEAVMKATSK
jgi:hypothetical protein